MNILVVEDEERLAQNIASALKLQTYNVTVVHDGQAALDAVALSHFDLVVLDIMMPVMDGLTALRTLRENGNSVPVLMLTALGETDHTVTGLDAGADDYLAKPFELAELLARVRTLLRRQGTTVAQVLTHDSLTLDRGSKTVTRAGQVVALSATEYRLLEYLLLQQGQVLGEADLLEHVWDQNYDGLSNVVSVYIGYLRAKLDKAFPDEPPLITTVRGLGYRLG